MLRGYWSDEHQEILGYEPGTQLQWEQWLKGVHPEDRERVTANASLSLARVRAEGHIDGHKDAYRFIRPDGNIVWIESESSVNIADGEPVFRGYIRDISERKKAEETLSAAHKQTQSIIDNTTSIVYAFDTEERFILANAAVAKVLNSTPEKMIGKRRHEFMPADDADWHEANDRKVFETGKPLEFEEYSHLKDRPITWLTTKFPLRDHQGNLYAVAGISTDISLNANMSRRPEGKRGTATAGFGCCQSGDMGLAHPKRLYRSE